MIAIIDYGVGNLFSLKSSLKQLGLEAVVTADADTICKADRLIPVSYTHLIFILARARMKCNIFHRFI